jgi:hypothetical protein
MEMEDERGRIFRQAKEKLPFLSLLLVYIHTYIELDDNNDEYTHQ